MLLLVAFDRRSNIWKPALIFLKKILENYVFPILKPGLTPSQQRDRIKEFARDVNDGIKTICFETGIEDRVTTYSARCGIIKQGMIQILKFILQYAILTETQSVDGLG